MVRPFKGFLDEEASGHYSRRASHGNRLPL